MVVRKSFNLLLVIWNIRKETLMIVVVSGFVWLLHLFTGLEAVLPFSIAAIQGSGLAIFIAFRNQSAYGRWWEARTIWGGIINNSRIFARQLIVYAQGAAASGKASEEQVASFQKEMVYRHIAFVHALRLHLRRQENWTDFKHLLDEAEYDAVLKKANKPNLLLQTQGRRIREAMQQELLLPFDNLTMEPNLAQFSNWQGACERIKNTPLPRNYHFFTRLFLYVFLVLLPFSLLGDFVRLGIDFLLVPLSFVISSVYAIMNRVGELNEDPFDNKIHDVPMTALCNTIERDLKEQLGESNLPVKLEPEDGILF